MKKNSKAAGISKLLKQGYTPAQIKDRMAVSESYVHAIKKKLAEKPFTLEEVGVSKETFAEVAHQASQGKDKDKDKPTPKHEPEVNVVDKVLDARADQYGSFMQGADIAVRIKGIMHNAIARKDMHLFPDQLLALDMIAVKISRIVNGNASHRDSWLDIAGYAKLVADRLGGVSR